MRAMLSLLVFLTVPAFGQSALPPCDPNVAATSWTNCQGTFTHATGNKHVGEYRDGKFHGQGTYTWADGDKYVGEFRDGKPNGQGTHYFLAETQFKGDKYVGEYRDGTRHGQGTLTFANGDKYVGEFRDGKVYGQGIYTYANGRPPLEGLWDGKFVRAQRIPDHIAGRTSTPPLAQAPRQAKPTAERSPGSIKGERSPSNSVKGKEEVQFAIECTQAGVPTGKKFLVLTSGKVYLSDGKKNVYFPKLALKTDERYHFTYTYVISQSKFNLEIVLNRQSLNMTHHSEMEGVDIKKQFWYSPISYTCEMVDKQEALDLMLELTAKQNADGAAKRTDTINKQRL